MSEQSGSFHAQQAPPPVGAYPHAKKVGPFLFLSGMGPRAKGQSKIPGVEQDENGKVLHYDIAEQTRAVFQNVKSVLEASGAKWEDLVDVTVFLTDIQADFQVFNQMWSEYFTENPPCRTTVQVQALPTPIAVELKCTAYFGND